MKCIDLFGGIGGFRKGLEQANELVERTTDKNARSSEQKSKSRGWKWKHSFDFVWYCEKDKYAVQIYNKNFKTNYEPTDITTIETKDIPDFDMLCAGFPCQSFSIAGKRKGFQDTRGTMFFEICRLVKAKEPSYVLLENVKGLLSADNGRCFYTILLQLDELGYNVEWQVLNSKNFGVPQNRERVFIIGHLRGNGGQQVFPIRQGSSEIGQAQQQVSSTIHKGYYKQGGRDQQYVVDKVASMYGKNHQAGSVYSKEGISPTLDDCQGGYREPMIIDRADMRRDSGTGPLSRKDGYSYCLDGGNSMAIEVLGNIFPSGYESGNVYNPDGISPVLKPNGPRGSSKVASPKIMTDNIRRLTPVECERLQGFPDGWTDGVSDTQRYKQLGNAVTVNVVQMIGKKFLTVL